MSVWVNLRDSSETECDTLTYRRDSEYSHSFSNKSPLRWYGVSGGGVLGMYYWEET